MSVFNDSREEYYKIIEEARSLNRVKTKNAIKHNCVYYESHHIIPKSIGGPNTRSNLVLLTPEEHYVCHSLLPDFCEGESKAKMTHAWNIINNVTKNGIEIIGSEKYGELKRARSECIVGSKHPGAKIIYQVDRDSGALIKKWDCITDAADTLKIDISLISAAARGRQKSAGNFIWRYEENYSVNTDYSLVHPSNYRTKANHCRARKIVQVDKDTGKIIKEWSCITNAATSMGGNNGDLTTRAKTKRGTAFGFRWYYSEEYNHEEVLDTIQQELLKEKSRGKNNAGPVHQISLQTNQVLKTWNCIADASRALGMDGSGIGMCCQGKGKSAGKFGWEKAKQTLAKS